VADALFELKTERHDNKNLESGRLQTRKDHNNVRLLD
jgi:hypothetical protein